MANKMLDRVIVGERPNLEGGENNLLQRINAEAEISAKLLRTCVGETDEILETLNKTYQLLCIGEQSNCQNIWEVKSSLADKKTLWDEKRAVVRDSYHQIKEEKLMLSDRLMQLKKELDDITEANNLLECKEEPKLPLLLMLLSPGEATCQ